MASRRRRPAFAGLATASAALLLVQACTSREVALVEIVSVTVSPETASLLQGETQQFTAAVRDDRGAVVAGAEVQWSSDNPSVVQIGADGVAVALQPGTATISAEFLGVVGTATVTVIAAPAISVDPTSLTFLGTPGGANPGSKTVEVTNSGGGMLENLSVAVRYQNGADWLVAPLSSTTAPATLTVTPQIAGLSDGQFTATVELSSPGALNPVPVPVTLLLTSISVSESEGTVDEKGLVTDSFTVALNATPSSDVVLLLSSADPDEVTVSPTTLTFTLGDWETPQTVIATGHDDLVDDGDTNTNVVISVDDASSDDAFDVVPDLLLPVTTIDNGAGIIVTESGGSSLVTEAGGQDDLTVVLNGPPSSNVVLNVSSDPTEVMVNPSTLTFTLGNWSQAQLVTLTGVDDALFDGDQVTNVTFAVEDALSDDAYDPVANVSIQVTTTDDDVAGISITESDNATQVTEAAGLNPTDSITVVLTSQPTSNVVLNVVSGTPAQATIDKATLTFTAGNWSTPQVVIVTAVDDAVDDGDVVVPVTFSVNDAQSDDLFDPLPDQVVQVTTIDNDGAEFVLAGTAGLSVSEAGGAPAVFTVVLATQPQAPVRVTITAADPGEVNVSTPSVTFLTGNWDQPQPISLLGVDDEIDDGDVTSTVTVAVDTLNSGPDYRPLSPKTVSVTTVDNDAASVTLSVNKASLSESGANNPATVTATLSVPSTQQVTVNLGFSGTATLTSDYTRSSTSIVIPAMSTSRSVTINAVSDAIDEPDETVVVDITGVTNAAESGTQQVTVTLADDDDPPTVSIGDAAVTEGNAPGTTNANFNVTLSGQSAFTVTVRYATVPAGGTATAGSDYTAIGTPVTLTFAPGDVSETATVVVQGDNIDEPNETFHVTLSSPSNATIGDGTGVGTINDDDNPPTISIDNATVTEGNPPNTVNANFNVTLSAASGRPVTVQYATVPAGGTATAGTDYIAITTPVTLTFAPGDVSETATVVVQGDNIDEPNETFNVTLSSPVNATIADGTGVGTINDDDDPPMVTWTAASQSNAESVTTVTITAQLSAMSTHNVSVPFSVGGGSSASNPADYTISAGPLTIPAESTQASLTITVVDDGIDEPDETVIVNMGTPTNATQGAITTHTATIEDNDDPPTVAWGAASQSNAESVTTVTVTAQLSAMSALDVSVPFSVGGGSTATSPADYTISASPLSIPAGSTQASLTITVVNDGLDEADETVIVNMGSPTNATQGAITAHTVTIADDDDPPTVSWTAAGQSNLESVTTLTVTAQLSTESGRNVTVPFSVAGASTAALTSDYTISAGPLTIPAGQTTASLTITVVDDAIAEVPISETVIVEMGTPTNATATAPTTHAATILDDDEPGDQIFGASGPTTEDGGSATFTVLLTSQPTVNVTIDVASDSTATAPADYTAITPTTVSFSPGQTIAVSVNGDAEDEGVSEDFSVVLNTPSNVTISDGTGADTITDDDAAGFIVSAASGPTSEDGGTATFTVELTSQPTEDVRG